MEMIAAWQLRMRFLHTMSTQYVFGPAGPYSLSVVVPAVDVVRVSAHAAPRLIWMARLSSPCVAAWTRMIRGSVVVHLQ